MEISASPELFVHHFLSLKTRGGGRSGWAMGSKGRNQHACETKEFYDHKACSHQPRIARETLGLKNMSTEREALTECHLECPNLRNLAKPFGPKHAAETSFGLPNLRSLASFDWNSVVGGCLTCMFNACLPKNMVHSGSVRGRVSTCDIRRQPWAVPKHLVWQFLEVRFEIDFGNGCWLESIFVDLGFRF